MRKTLPRQGLAALVCASALGLTVSLRAGEGPSRLPATLLGGTNSVFPVTPTAHNDLLPPPPPALTFEVQARVPVTSGPAADPLPTNEAPRELAVTPPLGHIEFPTVYRDRPKGHSKKKKADVIYNNRTSEPQWYREWRCTHYGYYPTQWRPWPNSDPNEGGMPWHLGRNAIYKHPYDLKQPEPVLPPLDPPSRDGKDAKRPVDPIKRDTPRSLPTVPGNK